MDKNGVWHNEHGKFEHPKIIRHFNRSIQKDDLGYYLFQQTDECEEKVYFPHEDTVLFVVDFSLGEELELTLNTTQKSPLIQHNCLPEMMVFTFKHLTTASNSPNTPLSNYPGTWRKPTAGFV